MGRFCFSNVLLLAFKVAKEFARVLCKSPASFMLVGKASALTCDFLNSKMCETTLSVRQKMQAHIWRHLQWHCNLKRPLPFLLLLDNKGEIIATSQSRGSDERHWQVESVSTGIRNLSPGNLSFEDCESSFLTKCPSCLGKLSKTGTYQGMLLLEIMRWTCACSESWNVTVKNH